MLNSNKLRTSEMIAEKIVSLFELSDKYIINFNIFFLFDISLRNDLQKIGSSSKEVFYTVVPKLIKEDINFQGLCFRYFQDPKSLEKCYVAGKH